MNEEKLLALRSAIDAVLVDTKPVSTGKPQFRKYSRKWWLNKFEEDEAAGKWVQKKKKVSSAN